MLQVVKASAGAGKTYFLTKEYLLLAFKSPGYFKSILAVTFTNKAAEEMKQRILNELNILATGGKSDFEESLIEAHKHINKQDIADFARKVQEELLHDYSLFEVKTIDSFIQSLIRSFSYEIGIQKSYDLVLDTNEVIDELIKSVLEESLHNVELLGWLTSFLEQKIAGQYSYDILNDLQKFAGQLFKEEYQKLKINSALIDSSQLDDLIAILKQEINAFESYMHQLSEKARISAESLPSGKLGNVKHVLTYLTEKIGRQEKKYEPGQIVQNFYADYNDVWDKSIKNYPVLREYKEFLYPILLEAVDYFNQNKRAYYSASSIFDNLYQTLLMNQLEKHLPKYREINNALIISDLNMLLHQIQSENEALYVYDKIGNRLNHILIDEFQDTSNFQWDNFKPLISNSLSEGNKCLVVGDIKQAIYRFRSGDWRLLHFRIKEYFQQYVRDEILEHNYRSHKNIVWFNNMFFKLISEKIQEKLIDENALTDDEIDLIAPYKSVISDVYSDVAQKIPKNYKGGTGRVSVNFLKKDQPLNIAPVIDQLLKEKDYTPGDIAILVRGNDEAEQIAGSLYNFMQTMPDSKQYSIITPKSLLLQNSEAVNAVINFLYYAHSALDKISLVSLYRNLQIIKGKSISTQDIENLNAGFLKTCFPPEFLKLIENKQQYTIYELSERVIQVLDLLSDNENVYLQTFLDYLHEFSFKRNAHFDEFKKWWEKKKTEFSVQIPEKTDSLRILTVHKSKGLAFNVVIIPSLDKFESTSSGNSVWARNKWPKLPEAVFNVTLNSEITHSFFAIDYYLELVQEKLDLINLVYVAFTRPVYELIVFAKVADSGDKLVKQMHELLRNALPSNIEPLADFSDAWKEEEQIFELGADFKSVRHKPQVKKVEMLIQPNAQKADWREKISFRSSLNEFLVQSVQALHDKVAYGKLLHLIMAQVKYADEVEHVFRDLLHEKMLNKSLLDELKPLITSYVEFPGTANWFSHEWTVENEQGIITQTGELRIPDRVMQNQKQMLVVDYKFAIPAEEHLVQVHEYIAMLENMQTLPVLGYLYYPQIQLIKQVF